MTVTLTDQQIESYCSQIDSSQLSNINVFLLFLGHAHSGHSLIGALLDSHPQIAITNEVNAAKLLRDHSLNANQLMSVMLHKSFENAKQEAWLNTGYSYKTTTGFQGKTTHPKIIGDKKGGGNTRILMNSPYLVNKFLELFGEKLKFIQVIRDPLDNIAAFAHYWNEPLGINHVQRYFENLHATRIIKRACEPQFYELNYSDFMADPKSGYKNILSFLNINATESLIDKTIGIVRARENKRSNAIKWPKEVMEEIDKYLNNLK